MRAWNNNIATKRSTRVVALAGFTPCSLCVDAASLAGRKMLLSWSHLFRVNSFRRGTRVDRVAFAIEHRQSKQYFHLACFFVEIESRNQKFLSNRHQNLAIRSRCALCRSARIECGFSRCFEKPASAAASKSVAAWWLSRSPRHLSQSTPPLFALLSSLVYRVPL